ncbi:hypothetical protein BVI2075_310003 [Burkholderia vietnamiensis]|nr:hypothetical protein BVI2075_310003 [Burkholderia vietnamiensis]CAG9227619.1 hypothetical protein BVI1335_680022 [Burkholderia vietnamiensis]
MSPLEPACHGTRASSPGQKPPLKLCKMGASRTGLQMASNPRGLAPFNLAIGSSLGAGDLTWLLVQDVREGNHVASRATSCSRKPSGQCNWRPQNRPARTSKRESEREV